MRRVQFLYTAVIDDSYTECHSNLHCDPKIVVHFIFGAPLNGNYYKYLTNNRLALTIVFKKQSQADIRSNNFYY